MNIDALLAAHIARLRKAQHLTLAQLSERSGVSRSMISLIERQETSPTAAVLNKLADALGVSLPALFAAQAPGPEAQPVARQADQPVWTDPASGYVRRHLSPTGVGSPLELVDVCFPAGETVVFDNPVRQRPICQQLWVLEGAMAITLHTAAQARTWQLATGDCLAMALGARTTFHNPGTQPARYLLALAHTSTHTPETLPRSTP